MSRKKRCESCGTFNFSGDVYCSNCGGALYGRNILNEKKSKIAIFSL